MVRKLVAAVSIALLSALVAAGPALAAPGGIGPPTPHTPSGEAISRLYWIVFGVCAVVFVLVESALILFIVRFRRRRDTPEGAEGPQIHGNTRLEIIWTAIPAIVLAALAVFTFTQIPAVQARGVENEEHLTIRVEAHQFYWEYRYPGGQVSVNTLYLPVDEPVQIDLTSLDVVHSWWVPSLTGKMDAFPDRVNTLRFVPETVGEFEGKCAELCGVQHAFMPTTVQVVDQADYEASLAAAQEPLTLGKATWEGVCATCHGLAGQGDVGPAIAGNGTLTNPDALRTLLLNGQDTPQFSSYMPAVALGWPPEQFAALLAYIKSSDTLSTTPAPTTTGGGG
jgi:cytochrome c oxidase subunit II